MPLAQASAQSCSLHRDCSAGNLCSNAGSCQPLKQVLNLGGNTFFWVDQANGDDLNPGTEAQPWKTIRRAAENTSITPGDAIIIREGIYYEAIRPQVGGVEGRHITYAAYPGDDVVVSGLRNIPGTWIEDGENWYIDWPFSPLATRRVHDGHPRDDPARRRDVLVVDNQMLSPVYALADLREGAFYLEGSPDAPVRMHVRMPRGKSPATSTIQTSTLSHLFNPSDNPEYCTLGQNVRGYFRLIGLQFRHVANEAQEGAVCSGSRGALIEDVSVEWTNGAGFLITGDRHVIRGTKAWHNGMSGMRGSHCTHCLVEKSSSKYNNWKGYDPFWESGGGKWQHTENTVFKEVDFSDNQGPGLWLDIHNTNNTVEQSRFDNNYGVNLFIEYQSNGNTIVNNVLTRARFARPAFFGYGLLIHASNQNVVLHNTFMANEGGGMRIRADDRGRAIQNRYYNNLFVANTRVLNDGQRRGSELAFEEHRTLEDARSNLGAGNLFWKRNYATHEFHTFQFRPSGASGTRVLRSSNLAQWQNFAQTDHHSQTLSAALNHVADTTDYRNGWRLIEGSQVIGKAVSLPSDIAPVRFDFDGNPRSISNDIGAHQYQGARLEPLLIGDVSQNGTITALDASLIFKLSRDGIPADQDLLADTSGDGKIDFDDAALVLKYIAGIISCFPSEQGCVVGPSQ